MKYILLLHHSVMKCTMVKFTGQTFKIHLKPELKPLHIKSSITNHYQMSTLNKWSVRMEELGFIKICEIYS